MRTLLVATVFALAGALCACRGPDAPPPPVVRIHAPVGDAPLAVAAQGALARRLATLQAVASPAEAELLWLADPADALALADRALPGSAPAANDVDPRFKDPQARFAPVCARARVLLVSPRAALPFAPENLRDLADPRLAGRVAVPGFATPDGAATAAALGEAYGNASASRFLDRLARNQPVLVASDAEVRDRVARGEAWVGLAGTEAAAAGAASAAALEVVVPDQAGRGAVVLPTALAIAPGASDAAVQTALWLAGAEAERLLVARVPGWMPLRDGVPVPVGVPSAGAVRALVLDWDRFAADKAKARAALKGWPDEWRK